MVASFAVNSGMCFFIDTVYDESSNHSENLAATTGKRLDEWVGRAKDKITKEYLRQKKKQSQDKMNHSISRRFDLN